MSNLIHLLIRTTTEPPAPQNYTAICDYESETKREFSESLARVNCDKCLERAAYRQPCSLGATES